MTYSSLTCTAEATKENQKLCQGRRCQLFDPVAVRTVKFCYDCSFFFCLGTAVPSGPGPPHSRGLYITHNDAPQSVGLLWTSDQSVAETSTWQHTTLNNRHTSIPPVGFEPTISAGEWPKTYALDRAATGTGYNYSLVVKICPYYYSSVYVFIFVFLWWGARSDVVVKALRSKPAGRGFDSRWCNLNFSVT